MLSFPPGNLATAIGTICACVMDALSALQWFWANHPLFQKRTQLKSSWWCCRSAQKASKPAINAEEWKDVRSREKAPISFYSHSFPSSLPSILELFTLFEPVTRKHFTYKILPDAKQLVSPPSALDFSGLGAGFKMQVIFHPLYSSPQWKAVTYGKGCFVTAL